MINWTVTYNNQITVIPAHTYAEALALARARACHGRPRYRTRAEALAAGAGPAYPCENHFHASDLDTA